MNDRIFRVVVTAEADRLGRGVWCRLDPCPSWPSARSFAVASGQTLDVTEELGPDVIDPADRVQHVLLARILAMHSALSSVRLERRELSPWEPIEFTRQEATDGY